ncbi:hypothetical protein O181_095795 [Austropuccinia psidii MF-1]|uniref:Uncharacterized protein n=1 Tax=Austropuccinia psidii MF-1 TaxID=1389203 RepID=A0A9Q3J4I6_9BASI|nr:hypothetical protein [Austropuccinia psidii MF-1]
MSINCHSPQGSSHGLWKSPEATSHLQKGVSLQDQGNPWPSSKDPSLWEPAVVHIWYYIPLCTISPQKFNGDGFRTPLCHLKSSPQANNSFQRKASAPQSYNP